MVKEPACSNNATRNSQLVFQRRHSPSWECVLPVAVRLMCVAHIESTATETISRNYLDEAARVLVTVPAQ